jgi:dihydrodipicolinate synthase/N-acetylneuraminate lyase
VLLEAMAAGADGGVNGGANLFPELYVALWEAIDAGDQQRARELQDLVARVNAEVYQVAPAGPGFLYGIKAALEELGLASGLLAEPLTPLSGAPRARIRTAIHDIAAHAARATGR